MAVYRFDSDLACEYGVNEAIFIHNMAYWVWKNKEKDTNFFDGKTWTYNTVKSFEEIFSFWSNQTIRTVIKSLTKKGVIISGNYNKAGYDRTKWYAFSDETRILAHLLESTNGIVKTNKWNCENQQMELLESTNGIVKTNKPIPDIKPNIKPDIKPNSSNSKNLLRLHKLLRNKSTSVPKEIANKTNISIANKITEEQFVLLENYYSVGKSEIFDITWNRKTSTKTLLNNIETQIENAEEFKSSKQKQTKQKQFKPVEPDWINEV